MFHILETRPTKVRWCWLARERGTSTASPLVSTILVLRVATLGGCRNPARCGTPCTCALWNTTSAATSLRCSSESRGLTGSNWAGRFGGLQHPPVAGLDAGCCPASECARLHTTSRRGRRTLSKAAFFAMCFDVAVKLSSRVHLYSQNLDGFLEWERNAHQTAASLPTAGRQLETKKPPLPVFFSGAKFHLPTCTPLLYNTQLLIDLISSTPTVMSRVGAGESTVISVSRLLAAAGEDRPRRCSQDWPHTEPWGTDASPEGSVGSQEQ
ncbi:hypothetical protein GWK47_020546 [Chionoecetes opilio]|uniref:Uncharacterized protein n=1 Tax=Chionoecetes opilio TaxID=41210 RepID=A0A8J5CIB3_CHIOP|nr:hypothetical protein GWK47_020546 [Chionoecetes opilio]